MREKFMFFANFKETADKLPDDLRLKFYDAMTDYVFNGVEPDDNLISALITAIKPSLDKVDERGGAREGAGRPKSNEIKNNQNNSNEIKRNQNNQSFLETETETETRNRNSEKESLKKKVANASHFQKPSLEQVMAYCKERNNTVDAERFMDFYESKGWKVGNQPMKDWEAAVRTWEKREQPKVELALPSKVSDDTIDEIVRKRKESDEEQRKRAEEANRRSEFIKGKGYPSMLALISAGKDVYDRVMSEYKQAQGF